MLSEDFIPLCVPEIGGNEGAYLKECVDTGWVSSVGAFVDRFESEFAAAVGAKGAVCTSSGTTALHIALLLAGVKANEEVIVPSLTFIAPVNAIRYVGAWPVFMDSVPDHWQIDPAQVEHFLARECDLTESGPVNKNTGRRVAAILPVHCLGHPVDLEPVRTLAATYRLALVEDITESLMSRYKGSVLGSDTTLGCFSFNGNKLITTGGGGMLVSQNADLLKHAKHLTTQAKADGLEYIHDEVGYNYRLPNLLAAFGCAQLEQLSGFIERKREIACAYLAAFDAEPDVEFLQEAEWADMIQWLFTIKLSSKLDARGLIRYLAANGIQARPLWQPNHLSAAHSDAERRNCPVAEGLFRSCVSLPSSAGLTKPQQQRVIQHVLAFLRS